MRTLLVDNYDSFTYNLFHRIAEVNGREPEVVRNDDPAWRPGLLKGFDNVLLSPGQGTPFETARSGICAEVAAHGRLPVLGVGLGHQAIALAHGGSVGRAPWPCHGRTSPVRHTGSGLFHGLPNPLEVVRYHSLAVTGLSPALEPAAWATDDGVVMALRHCALPLWGVQFHPESAGAETGPHLLANFRDLTERHGRVRTVLPMHAPMAPRAPGRSPRGGRPPQRRRQLRVLLRRLHGHRDAEAVFDRLFRSGDHAFWLDSSRTGVGAGRFSVLGNADGPLARIATANVAKGTVSVRAAGSVEVVRSGFLDFIEADLRSLAVDCPDVPCDFALGWVGFLTYELKAECGGARAHRSRHADAVMVFADRAVVLDHDTDTLHLLALAEEGQEAPARAWLSTAHATLTHLRLPHASAASHPSAARPVRLRLRHERERYLRLVDACQEELTAGRSYGAYLANMIEARTGLDPWHAYRSLRRIHPAPFGAFLGFGPLSVLSASPERLLHVNHDARVESTILGGSRPRGATPQEDALLVADLATSERDRAEHLTLVDVVRHDLGSLALTSTVSVDPFLDVETGATAHRMVSTVRAKLRADAGAAAVVRSAFPGASVTGAPKLGTTRITDRLESGPRGIHTGAVGYFSLTGAADFALATHTALLTGHGLRYGIGAIITAASDPDDVLEQTALQAEPLLTLLGARLPGRGKAVRASRGRHF
ncbi:chorismate-binding protein [Streptomyces sp. NPDC002668]|uniref:chorismate-binding protein n=1 Tax=Streptomyces sp. NPDC002668 TaxID=3154422 RepID=UPI00331BA5AD